MAPPAGRRLEWDTTFFGVSIGQAEAASPADVEAAELWAERGGIRCVYLLVAADRFDAARAAESRGFFLTGVRMTWSRPARVDGPGVSVVDMVIRNARPSDIPALEQIAATSYGDSRFYADPNFSRASCDRLYETWIRSSCEGWADRVLTVERDGRVAGYVSLHRRANAQGVIGLVGVALEARRLGVGRALVAAAMDWFRDQGVDHVSVATQAQNIGAIHLYQQVGFTVSHVDLWLHKWR